MGFFLLLLWQCSEIGSSYSTRRWGWKQRLSMQSSSSVRLAEAKQTILSIFLKTAFHDWKVRDQSIQSTAFSTCPHGLLSWTVLAIDQCSTLAPWRPLLQLPPLSNLDVMKRMQWVVLPRCTLAEREQLNRFNLLHSLLVHTASCHDEFLSLTNAWQVTRGSCSSSCHPCRISTSWKGCNEVYRDSKSFYWLKKTRSLDSFYCFLHLPTQLLGRYNLLYRLMLRPFPMDHIAPKGLRRLVQ
jgi:hypothetical protein